MKTIIFVAFTLSLVTVFIFGDEHCGEIADVAFIIDSSRSIWIYDFQRQLRFVQQLVKSFDVGPNRTHIAALTFSHFVEHELYFEQYQNAESIVDAIGNISFAQGDQTLTYDAITSMRTELFSPEHGAREGVPRVCILLTDGHSTDKEKTLAEAEKAKADGITIIGVGIGQVDKDELREVVTPPFEDNLFFKNTFSELESTRFQSLVKLRACKAIETTTAAPTTTTTTLAPTTTTLPPTTTTIELTTTTEMPTTTGVTKPEEWQNIEPKKNCQGKEADIVFVIDESSSIWSKFFADEMIFVADLVDKFDIDSGKTQVGLVTFSDNATVKFHLNDHKEKVTMEEAIREIKPEGGITNTHLALRTMLDDMFDRKHGSRPGVAHICILITDGRSSKPDLTEEVAEEAHDSGIYVFAIGVGNMTDKAELEMMASNPVTDFAFEVNGYKALPKIKDILAYKTCEVPSGDEPQCTGDIQADIVFGLHGIGGDDRPYVEDFIRSVGGAFDLEAGRVRVGLIEDCNPADIELGQFSEKEAFVEGLSESMTTRISPFLHRLRMSFGRQSSRDKFNRIAILIVSGDIEDVNKAYSDIMRLKHVARVIVVGVGEGVSTDQLMSLASYKDKFTPDNSHVFPVEHASDLMDIVRKIHVRMCQEQ